LRSAGLAWVDGALVDAADARVSIFDHGLTVGDGVFETLKVHGGTPFAITRHLARLRRSASGLGLDVPLDDDELRDAISGVVDAGPDVGRVRITVTGGVAPPGSGRGTAGPTIIVAGAPLEPWAELASVATVPWPRNERSAIAGLKTTSYAENVVALAHAHDRGAGEAIFGNLAGNLCEGTGSNVFVVIGGDVITPPLSSGCLAGITRDLVIERIGGVTEADVPLSGLDDAVEIFLTSSTRDVQAVGAVDGRSLVAPGHATSAIAAEFAALIASDPDP
jgi:branched-chain amino acid aminotransferase